MENLKLITCIVDRGKADRIVKEILKMQVAGATIFYARGTGVRQKLGFFKRAFVNPEKEVFMTVVPVAHVDEIFDKIVTVGKLDKPGHGLAFIQDVGRTAGLMEKK